MHCKDEYNTKYTTLRSIKGSRTPEGESILRSVMYRTLNGEISFWDKGAETAYGYPKGIAVGNTSHHLLKTIFPEPLTKINQNLISNGKWTGELIHTRNDGLQVKVLSEWKIIDEEKNQCTVQEINHSFTKIRPETAQLREPSLIRNELNNRIWALNYYPFFTALIFTLLVLMTVSISIFFLTHHAPLHPFR